MHFNSIIAAAILAYASTSVLAVPIPQLAGEGAACDSILSSTDNGVGYGIENAEDNIAGSISAPPRSRRLRRQLAGEGAACNSIFSSTDNGVGYGVENAEDKIAGNLGGASTAPGGSPPPPPPPPPPHRRQLDKIANGAQAIGAAVGQGSTTAPVTSAGDNLDGTLTSGAANAGAQIGNTEVSTLEGAGSAVPKRQLDKIANGAQAIGAAIGQGSTTAPATSAADNLDGSLTSGAANLGAQIGNAEVSTLEGAGSAVPKR